VAGACRLLTVLLHVDERGCAPVTEVARIKTADVRPSLVPRPESPHPRKRGHSPTSARAARRLSHSRVQRTGAASTGTACVRDRGHPPTAAGTGVLVTAAYALGMQRSHVRRVDGTWARLWRHKTSLSRGCACSAPGRGCWCPGRRGLCVSPLSASICMAWISGAPGSTAPASRRCVPVWGVLWRAARNGGLTASRSTSSTRRPAADQRGHRLRRGSRGRRPPAFDRATYKHRRTLERCINRLKHGRGIATR
jgi:hypothetical protein